jgi:TonB family protein
MKKTLLMLIACIFVACVAAIGVVVLPVNKADSKKKPAVSKQVKSAENLPKALRENFAPKPTVTTKPELTKEQTARIGQAFHERREKALREKNHAALIALGKEVRDGAAFPGYQKLAAMCFADAAKSGSPEGMLLAGWCHEKGFGVNSSSKRAFDYYFEAGEAGLADGYNAAVRMILAGNNIADLDTASTLIDKAVAMGSTEAKFLKGTLLLAENSDIQAGLACLTEAAQADYPDAQRLLGRLYREGKIVPKDLAAAAEWAKYAADLGLASANVDYARLAMAGTSGGGGTEGIERLMQAASQNNADAAYQIASLYRSATNVSRQEVETTRSYATSAFDNGVAKAAFLMATTYPPQDSAAILEWLQKGVKADDLHCLYASRLIENENITPYEAVRLAKKATVEEAINYGLSKQKVLSQERTPPTVVSLVQPAMPAALRTIDLNTEVRVKFLVNEDGIPINPQVTTPSPYEELNKAATDAVAQWRFKPATRDGVIVPMQMIAPVKFQSRR